VLFPVSRPSPCLICFMQLPKVLGPRLLLWPLLRCALVFFCVFY
jgi:hypothetical protein